MCLLHFIFRNVLHWFCVNDVVTEATPVSASMTKLAAGKELGKETSTLVLQRAGEKIQLERLRSRRLPASKRRDADFWLMDRTFH